MASHPVESQSSHRVYTCTYCSQVFYKLDHIARHERSHTKQKPYPCTLCDKCFSRRDALYRHLRAHAGKPGPSEYRRKSLRSFSGSFSGTAVPSSPIRSDQESTYSNSEQTLAVPSMIVRTPQEEQLPTEVSGTPSDPQSLPSDNPPQSSVVARHPHSGHTSSRSSPASHPSQASASHLVSSSNNDLSQPPIDWPLTSPFPPIHAGMNSAIDTANNTQYDPSSLSVDILELLSTSELPFSSSIQATPSFYQSLGINLAGSVHNSLGPLNQLSSQGDVDWAALAGMSGELPSATSSGWSRIATGPSNTVQLGGDQSSSLDQDDQVANRAITQTHALVANMSTNVISQMNLVSSHFLDRCLSAYFNRFLAALPITHRATFNIRTTNAPLLLSMIAVGSLCLQSDDARRLGDSIWRLANTAVSSSWQELIKIKGDFDSCQGLALVTTVLLVQIYATASTDPELKNSAVVAQPLGFRCARLAGMFDTQTLTQAETVSSEFKALEGQALTDRWYKWSARETQQRTLLGLYLMDAQVCSLFDAAPSVRHTLSQLSPVCTDAAFYAPTAEAWQKVMVDEDGLYGSPYRGPLSTLYSCNPSSGPLRRSITSGFTVAALLDGIYCLVVEQRDLPLSLRNEEMSSLIDRLDRFRNDFLLSDKPEIDIPALAMKWHTTSISLLELWLPTGIALKENAESINKWFSTPQGRRAVLHANAIRQVVDTMPFSAISTPRIQTPVCTYHAGYIMMLWLKSHMCAKGAGNWDLDHEVDWQRLGSIGQVISQRDLVTAVEGGGPETFVTEGGTTTLRGRKFDATGISALISALTTFGGTWPAARTMTNQLIAMSYA